MTDTNQVIVGKIRELLRAVGGLLDELGGEQTLVAPEIASKVDKAVAENRCLLCGKSLNNEKPIRGCHRSCYTLARRRITAGKVTELQLVVSGKLTYEKRAPGRTSAASEALDNINPDVILGLQKLREFEEQEATEAAEKAKRQAKKRPGKPKN